MHVSRSVVTVLVLLLVMVGALACHQEAEIQKSEKTFDKAVQEVPEKVDQAEKKLEETLSE